MIEALRQYGLEAQIRKNAAGVWVGEKKIASIGIAIRKWVSYHGIAINCVNDLKPFSLISPCGFNSEVMTRVCDLVEYPGRADFEQKIQKIF
jgi:lipoate-protein ligase B